MPVPPQFSHHVRAETVAVLHIPGRPYAEVHKAGCAHSAKAESVGDPRDGAEMVERTTTLYVDDYFFVAPCARTAN